MFEMREQTMRHIMVTGGVGSVGRAVIERLLVEYPQIERITIYSRDEHKQGDLARELAFHSGRLNFIIGDIRDRRRLAQSLDGVDAVIHAAAMRLVPHAEANPEECVKTNIIGAINLVDSVRGSSVRKVVGISSDKAVSPSTTYGASKFTMERIFLDADKRSDTRFSLVRYANILNSRSSVAPLFVSLRSGGVLPITDPEMTRFSIVMHEGVDLVLFALFDGRGGDVICPISSSYRVKDMATAIAPDAEQRIIGARPGEKMHESMFSLTEAPFVAKRGKYYVIAPQAGRWTLAEYCADEPGAMPLGKPFEYESGTNSSWLSIADIRQLVRRELGVDC
jgi:FlaA1/EpsC-like NDP-sugar epimerase